MFARSLLLGSVLAASPAMAAPDAPLLARIFNDHAVLQRGRPIVLWGKAAAGAAVTATLDGHTATGRADRAGRWQATLPAMAAGGPYTLSVTSGTAAQQVGDVLVGDVYLCGGQSNMEFPARLSTGAWGGLAPHAEPQLRFAHIEKDSAAAPRDELKAAAPWRIVDATSVGDASAVCFYMARSLQHSLHVPVGFIDSDWGGTTIQGWISPAALASVPAYAAGTRTVATLASDPAAARAMEERRGEAWWRTHDPRWAATKPWADAGFDDAAWPTIGPAGSWKGGAVPALAGFEGVVWLRKTVTLTAEQAAAADRLLLGPIDNNDTVWINGRWTGANGIAWFWRDYAVPAGFLHAGRNVIAVRLLGSGGPTGQPGDRQIKLKDGTSVPLTGPWSYQLAAPLKDETPPSPPWEVPTSLTTLSNGMIAPIARYGFKLAAWYQGEANVGDAAGYRTLLPLLIADWRRQTGTPALPFLVAQLATIGTPATKPGESSWAELRDVQAKAVRADPHAGLAVTLDLGDRYDIHPTQKLIVGERLARAARAAAYGEATAPGGPEVASVTRAGGDLVVAFRNGAGLRAYSADTAIGFEACVGKACRFVPGTIDGERIVLRGAGGAGVDKVRYAWADAPYVNLFNGDDLPAVPFEWPVTG
jgi:sialate O-acetylesterase